MRTVKEFEIPERGDEIGDFIGKNYLEKYIDNGELKICLTAKNLQSAFKEWEQKQEKRKNQEKIFAKMVGDIFCNPIMRIKKAIENHPKKSKIEKLIKSLIETIPSDEAKVILIRLGIGCEHMTCKEIGKLFGFSINEVKYKEQSAHSRLLRKIGMLLRGEKI